MRCKGIQWFFFVHFTWIKYQFFTIEARKTFKYIFLLSTLCFSTQLSDSFCCCCFSTVSYTHSMLHCGKFCFFVFFYVFLMLLQPLIHFVLLRLQFFLSSHFFWIMFSIIWSTSLIETEVGYLQRENLMKNRRICQGI